MFYLLTKIWRKFSFRAKILFPSLTAYLILALFSLYLIYKDKEIQKERAFDSYSVALDSINNIIGGRYIGRYTRGYPRSS